MTHKSLILLTSLFAACSSIKVQKKPSLWDESKNFCEKRGKGLVVVKSKEDLKKFDEDADKRDTVINFLVGFEYNPATNIFEYHSNQGQLAESDCTMWADGEPNKQKKSCAVMTEFAKVHMDSCDEARFFMCEQTQNGGNCDKTKGFFKYDDHCIRSVSVAGDVKKAVKVCGDVGGYVARILNEKILKYVLDEAYLSKYKNGLWIGLRKENGFWKHLDGGQLTEEQAGEIWADGYPGNDGCAAYSLRHERKIITFSCIDNTYFACDEPKN